MWIPGIMSAGLLVLCFFLLPETLFDRSKAPAQEIYPTGTSTPTEKEVAASKSHETRDRPSRPTSTITFAESLRFPRPRGNFLHALITPYRSLLFPGTIMVMLHYAGLVGLIAAITTVAPLILAGSPYNWGENIGLINAGGLIGAAFALVYTYALTDWATKRAAKRQQHGFAEPEERLPLMIPGLFMATVGSLVFGFSAQNPSSQAWVGLEFGTVCFPIFTFLFPLSRIRNSCPDPLLTFTYICSRVWSRSA